MFSQIEEWLDRIFKVIIFSAFSVLIILVFAQVYTRFLTTSSLTWSEELSRFVMIWMVFLSSIQVFRNNGHIWVENIINLFPQKIKSTILIIGHLLIITFCFIIIWGAFSLFPMVHKQYSPVLSIPMSYIYAAVPISLSITVFFAIKNLVLEIKSFR